MTWFPTRQRGLPIARGSIPAARFTPGSTVTGDDVQVYLSSIVGAPVIDWVLVAESNLVPGTISTAVFRPNADIDVGGLHASSGGGSPFYSRIDEAVLDTSDFTQKTNTSGDQDFNVDSAAFNPSTPRILSVSVSVVCRSITGSTVVTPKVDIPSTTEFFGAPKLVTSQTTVTETWTENPATGLPWTVAAIQAFDAANAVGVQHSATAADSFRVYQLYMTVTYTTETRVAVGSAVATAGLNTIAMATPAAVDTWGLTSGTTYLLVGSVQEGTGSAVWRALDSGDEHPTVGSVQVTVDANITPTAASDPDTAAPAFQVLSSTGLPLVGQPYKAIREEAVYAGRTVEQEATLADTALRGWLEFVTRQESIDTVEPLVAKLLRRSDDVQVAGDVTVDPHEVRDAPRLLQRVGLSAPTVAAGSAVQHYVEWSSDAVEGAGWLVPVLEVMDTTETQKLTTNQQGLETDTTGWVAGTNSAIVRTTTAGHFRSGVAALSLERSGGVTGTATASTPTGTSGYAVVPGARYAASVWVRAQTNARTVRASLAWYTAAGASISTDLLGQISSSTTFQQIAGSAVAPPTAAFGALVLAGDNMASGAAGDSQKWDDMSVLVQTGLILSNGGATDIATVDGSEDPPADIPVDVGVAHAAPTGFQVVAA